LGFCLLPANISSLTDERETLILEFNQRHLPSPSTGKQELFRWKTLWENEPSKPTTLQETVQHESTNASRFPNIVTILHVMLLAPVTSATVERANSALKFVKSNRRSRMREDRLNALLMLFVHKDIPLDLNKIVDTFALRCPRRMRLQNPLGNL